MQERKKRTAGRKPAGGKSIDRKPTDGKPAGGKPNDRESADGKQTDRKPGGAAASAVVEMTYIIPLILILFLASLYAIFYYHDKAILNGAAAETAAAGAQAARTNGGEETNLEELFYERAEGKLIYMTSLQVETTQTDTEVTVSVRAENGAMSLSVCQKAVIAKPEEEIRWAN